MASASTIVALATPPGRAALAIVRLSGARVLDIAAQLIRHTRPLQPRYAHRARIYDQSGSLIDDGLVLYFAAPASATGEDVLELHVHGSPLIAETVMATALAAGAQLAGPGEFTRRAFLNGKLNLGEAEAVADLIAAESQSAARAAAATLGGSLTRSVSTVELLLRGLIEELAAAIDFPDEVPDPARGDVAQRIAGALAILQPLIAGGALGQITREGAQVAIVGPPNAGKSSLLNGLLNQERAIVSPIAGTTRDTVEEAFELDGLLIRLIDTAGIRGEADQVEAAGIARTHLALAHARLVFIVLDGSAGLSADALVLLAQTSERERIILFNKADLGDEGYRQWADEAGPSGVLHGSVHERATLERIKSALRTALVGSASRLDLERPALARTRERDAAHQAQAALLAAQQTLVVGEALDLLVGDLTSAIAALGKITGATVDEETLDGIFARFCIGK